MLTLDYARLQRRVELGQQVYSTLALSYEQARIDEVRNTPLLILIDRPEGSARRYGSRAKDAIIWFLIGILFLWADLVHKVSLGSLSIAAVVAIFASFFLPVSSQVLVFGFSAAVLYVGAHARKEHHQKLRHYYVH